MPLLLTVSVPHLLLLSHQHAHRHTSQPHLVPFLFLLGTGFVKWVLSIPLNWKPCKINK